MALRRAVVKTGRLLTIPLGDPHRPGVVVAVQGIVAPPGIFAALWGLRNRGLVCAGIQASVAAIEFMHRFSQQHDQHPGST